jgi:hypothetical protein
VLGLEAFNLLYVHTYFDRHDSHKAISATETGARKQKHTKPATTITLFTYGDDICEETTKTGQVLDIGKGDD